MKIGKFIYNTISALILIAFLGLTVLLVGLKFVGYTPYAVLSGSMEPLYKVGSVVYVKEVDTEDIKVDDVITFYMKDGEAVVTHQVKEIDETKGYYYTQGLANENRDATPVTTERIIGKVAFGVPYLGYISGYVTRPPWLFIIIGAVLIWAIIVYMVDISKKDNQDDDKKKSKNKKCEIESENSTEVEVCPENLQTPQQETEQTEQEEIPTVVEETEKL